MLTAYINSDIEHISWNILDKQGKKKITNAVSTHTLAKTAVNSRSF